MFAETKLKRLIYYTFKFYIQSFKNLSIEFIIHKFMFLVEKFVGVQEDNERFFADIKIILNKKLNKKIYLII